MHRRYLVWVLLFLLLLGVVACGGAEEEASSVTPPVVPAVEEAQAEEGASPTEPSTEEPAPPTASVVTATAAVETVEASATTSPTLAAEPVATPLPPAQPVSSVQLVPVAGGFDQLTFLGHAFDERLFVVERPGRIQIVRDGERLSQPFLDISDRVGDGGSEQGLLSVAFHPNYAESGYFFVDYTNTDGNTVISRFQVSDDPQRALPDSELVLLTIQQPYGNHNGGQLQFGPDGYLYVGMGDGGSAGDPQNNGQDPSTLLGTLLRLDVDNGNENAPYAIPAGNPFVGDEAGRNEIWAIGLRNPWRFSFDRATGDLYVADVGQNQYEEVNFRAAGSPGGANYGWNIMEGLHCYREANCSQEGLLLPVLEYDHGGGRCSVTGGYVYRGASFPSLQGNYFYSDFCSGEIWSLRPLDGQWQAQLVADSEGNVTSFGEDSSGELYILTQQGAVYQLQP